MLLLSKLIALKEHLVPAASNALLGIFRGEPRFKRDDSVQLLKGGPLMVVEAVTLRIKGQPMVSCIWFDKESNSSRLQSFAEGELKFYDWYNPPPEHIRKTTKNSRDANQH